MTTLHSRKSINLSPLRVAFLLIPLALSCFAVSPQARAVTPAPDGGYPFESTAEGENAHLSCTVCDSDTAIGFQALFSVTTGEGNTAIGTDVLPVNTTGSFNTADGFLALFNNATGNNNTAAGANALRNNTTGSNNIAVGVSAGANLNTGSNNIYIGSTGGPSAGESNTIRIGMQGRQNGIAITGIYGATVASGIGVIITSDGRLGTIQSAERFKDAIKPMNKASEAMLALKPVTFRYKKEIDADGTPQFGLVAEDVAKVNPDLVVRDAEGRVYSVRYEAVNAMLLNEFLKEHRTVQELKSTVAKQEASILQQKKEFQAIASQQQTQIEALTTGLQKVSAQLEASKSAPQVVNNP